MEVIILGGGGVVPPGHLACPPSSKVNTWLRHWPLPQRPNQPPLSEAMTYFTASRKTTRCILLGGLPYHVHEHKILITA